MGFICQLGKLAIDKISSNALPAILKGKDGSLYLLDQINEKNAKVYEATSGRLKSSRVNLNDLKEWYSGEILIASPAKEDKKTLKDFTNSGRLLARARVGHKWKIKITYNPLLFCLIL